MGIIKKGKDYYIRYNTYEVIDGERKRIQHQEKIGPSRSLAEAALQKRLLERVEDKFGLGAPREKTAPTLTEFTTRYMADSRARKSIKMQGVDHNSSRHLIERLGDERMDQLSPGRWQEYCQARLQEVSPSSVNRELSCLKTMMNLAIEWELLQRNPVARVKKLLEPSERIRYLLKEEVKRLLACCYELLRSIVMMALYTGMRKGEITRLKWADTDLKNRTVHVKYPTRSKKLGRIVPIGKRLLNILEELERKNEYVFGGIKDPKKGFANACRKAGIQDFRFHDLRHTAASWMVMSGVNIVAVQKILGHAKLEMTMRYVQLNEETLRQAIETLENELPPE